MAAARTRPAIVTVKRVETVIVVAFRHPLDESSPGVNIDRMLAGCRATTFS